MKTKFIIILVIQFFVMLVFLVYAMMQKGIAQDSQKEAVAQKVMADTQALRSEQYAMEAQRQERIAAELRSEILQLRAKCK